ncbi:SPFH domain/band 7 family protein [Medicago truncatula]|uniref:SPFH domain/band 7 family protein n=1 Tax=Medicago truncatula TaxID=3880 RepID=G7J9M7_MEDTR|nr:SPFH domain/band 7 family protein [Medicago truncatula]
MFVGGCIDVKIVDPRLASYGTEDNPIYAAHELALSTIRSEIRKITLDDFNKEKNDTLPKKIMESINAAAKRWGLECLKCWIHDSGARLMSRIEKMMSNILSFPTSCIKANKSSFVHGLLTVSFLASTWTQTQFTLLEYHDIEPPMNFGIHFVPKNTAYIIERYGKYFKTLPASSLFLNPFLDKIAYVHKIRTELLLNIPSHPIRTKDNVIMFIKGWVNFEIVDPKLASYGVEGSPLYAVSQVAKTTIRSELREITLKDIWNTKISWELNNKIMMQCGLDEVGLLGAKPMPTPLEQNHNLSLAQGEFLENPERYRRLVGRLIYLCFTRPELSYSVHILSQFMQQPREDHWTAALRVVRYLKGNPGQGIFLDSTSDMKLHGWCDADWAACPITRRSLTGWVILGNSPISWKTKKQQVVSRSSAESEYRSMANTTCELKWVKSILCSLGISHSMPMQLYCDSQSALHIAKNPVFHERTKHIELDCHFVRNEILHGQLQPSYVSTHAQLADILTKALGRAPFQFLLGKLGIRNLHAPT